MLDCGTGFSREGGISDNGNALDSPASSRLKPVPLDLHGPYNRTASNFTRG